LSASRRRAADKKDKREFSSRNTFEKVRRAEARYAIGLRAIANHIGHVTKAFTPGDPDQMTVLQRLLRGYADIIKPWAVNHAERMLADVARRDFAVWARLSRTMSRNLRQEIETAPTGMLMRTLLGEQVALITSLPLEAAERVHKLTIEGMMQGSRAAEIAKEIMASGEVAQSRADLIAVTEVARTASLLVQARSEHVGSTGYIWRTARDARVRKEHKVLEGQFILWNAPPIAGSNGERAHAGQIYRCRCFPEPVLADEP
jgi:SPP1 gp7 family putative phage head morphogenesis protein